MTELLPGAMRSAGADLFIVLTRGGDPLGDEFGLTNLGARAAGLFYFDQVGTLHRTGIAAASAVERIDESGIYQTVEGYKQEGLRPHLTSFLERVRPARIAVNESKDLPLGDGLTSGMRRYLIEAAGTHPDFQLMSSQAILLDLFGHKFPAEIALIEQAVLASQQIVSRVLSSAVIQPGNTTARDIVNNLRGFTEVEGMEVGFIHVRLAARHITAATMDTVVQPGDLATIDFGITNDGYHSDIQRTAYVLREGEVGAPENIQSAWNTTVLAQDAALTALRPGVVGVSVDSAARQVIERAGYGGYPHAAGHSLGRTVHDIGPILGPDWPERYGSLVHSPVQLGQVFAVEPMVYAHIESQGGEVRLGLEENVVIEQDGPRVFGVRQRNLILTGR